MANADHSESAKRRKTGYSCCVANCTGKHSDFISQHKFPLDSSVRKQWIRFVKVCRADFGPSFGTPTNSRICERHFTPESYDPSYWLKQSLGIPCVGKQLKHGAVPTIQKHSFSTPLHRGQIVFTVSTTVTTTASCATSQCVVTSSGQRPKPSYVLPGVKKTRGAYAKREHQRTLDNIFTKNDECMELPVLPSADSSEVQEETGTAEGHTHTEPLQVKLKVRKKNKMVQVYPASVMQQQHLVRHRGTQCERNQKNAITQCNLALDSSHQPPTDGADQQSDTEMEMAADQQCEATFDAEYQPQSEVSSDDEITVLSGLFFGFFSDYVCELQKEVMGLASLASIVEMKEYLRAQDNQAPPPLCAEYEDARPEKLQAIADFQARFKWSLSFSGLVSSYFICCSQRTG
ncbi:hypothetical protein BaRGS_00028510 [Batillaria attramentaria]|uniref:THAP-type domain-containing protein n=1 Tax=Batillaria attramentaria TaxID=370345 RepID=A0ABD0JZL2_9CAEN